MSKRFLAIAALCAVFLTSCFGGQSAEAQAPEPPVAEETPSVTPMPLARPGLVFPQMTPMEDGEEIAVISTNFGDIKLRFFPDEAPKAVQNFITHAKDGYYDGLLFHRVIEGFMIQGGDPQGTGRGGESIWGTPFEDELTPMLHNFRGALSMANSGENTNGSQFFIVQNNGLDESNKTKLAEYLEYQDKIIGATEDGTEIPLSAIFPTEVVEKYLSEGGTPFLDFRHTVFGQVIEGMDVVDKIAAVETSGGNENKPLEDVVIQGIRIEIFVK